MRWITLAAAGAWMMFASVQAWAVPAYNVIDVGDLGIAFSKGYAINASGHVAGWSYASGGGAHAFRYNGATVEDLGTLGGEQSEGRGINNSGQVVGWSNTSGLNTRGFVYSGGPMQDLGTLGGFADDFWAWSMGINDSGQITGWADNASRKRRAFLYSGGSMQDLGTLGGVESWGNAINASGQVTGWAEAAGAVKRAFRYSGGIMEDLGPGEGTAINATGDVAGNSNGHAFVYSGGVMQDLGTFGGANSEAHGINASGHVVGWAHLSLYSQQRAFIYRDGVMQDLNALIAPTSGWTLIEANAINDNGWITGYGSGPSGTHAFLLTPTPEPGALGLLAGFASTVLLRRRGRVNGE